MGRGEHREKGAECGDLRNHEIYLPSFQPQGIRHGSICCTAAEIWWASSACLHAQHLALQHRCSALFTPFTALMVQSAVQCPIHHSPIWPPSLFFPPLLVLCSVLSPFLSTSLYKANETEVGPLFNGRGGTESKGGHKQGGREGGFKVHHCLCIPGRWDMCLGVWLVCKGCNMYLCVMLSFSHTHAQ